MWGDLVSIVVPVYNVEDYIEECLNSIIKQTYKNIEIIIVNDGSKDRTEEICRQFAEMDNRIHVISQGNRGVAIARKVGIRQAQGQFIGFVDGDDWIEENYYEKFMRCSGQFDLVTAGYKNGYGQEVAIFDKIKQGEYSSLTEIKYLLDNVIIYEETEQHGITTFLVNKLFRTDMAKIVSDETNEKLEIGEDSEFVYRYILKCNSVLVTDICCYYYRMRENSALHSINKHYLSNINELYCSLENAFVGHPYQESLILQLQKWTSRMISMSTSNMGFMPETQCMSYVFPFLNLLDNKSIVLYGAGKIGQNYYLQIKKWNICRINRWVDKQWENCQKKGLDVSSITTLSEDNYDYVIIAVLENKLAEDIKKQLVEIGVKEEKILWKEPLSTI